jgi:hypothetical protein
LSPKGLGREEKKRTKGGKELRKECPKKGDTLPLCKAWKDGEVPERFFGVFASNWKEKVLPLEVSTLKLPKNL